MKPTITILAVSLLLLFSGCQSITETDNAIYNPDEDYITNGADTSSTDGLLSVGEKIAFLKTNVTPPIVDSFNLVREHFPDVALVFAVQASEAGSIYGVTAEEYYYSAEANSTFVRGEQTNSLLYVAEESTAEAIKAMLVEKNYSPKAEDGTSNQVFDYSEELIQSNANSGYLLMVVVVDDSNYASTLTGTAFATVAQKVFNRNIVLIKNSDDTTQLFGLSAPAGTILFAVNGKPIAKYYGHYNDVDLTRLLLTNLSLAMQIEM
jgi:hypothetical protein